DPAGRMYYPCTHDNDPTMCRGTVAGLGAAINTPCYSVSRHLSRRVDGQCHLHSGGLTWTWQCITVRPAAIGTGLPGATLSRSRSGRCCGFG
ncbi:MAG: hypothetical protein NTY71_00405, partial [Methanoregula sp.]|nr:hypothetical protein [Methanoregula sp.]